MTVTEADPLDVAEWVAARGPALQRFAYLVTGSAVDAPDLVQEALARALPRWQSLVARGTAEAYLRRSIVNASISAWRKNGRQLPSGEPPMPPVGDGSQTRADADHAWALCAELPPQQRAAVVLRFYEDLPYAEIGQVLGCPESTARSHVHRALAGLRERLTTEPETEREKEDES
jgi:RNA polymerase sigma-70 factor (sigma-E family)